MYTVAEAAKACNMSPQAIYKKINGSMSEILKGHISRDEAGKILIDADGVLLMKSKPAPAQSPAADSARPTSADADTLTKIIENLQQENASLIKELEHERATVREFTEKTMLLANKLAELTSNSQILLKQHQDAVFVLPESASSTQESPAQADRKPGLLRKLFKK